MTSLSLFQHWISSLAMLKPRAFVSWVTHSWHLFINELTGLIRTFWWLFIIVLVATILCSHYVAMGIGKMPWYIVIVAGFILLGETILSTGFFLLISKKLITLNYIIRSILYMICLGFIFGLFTALFAALPNVIAVFTGPCFNFYEPVKIYVIFSFTLLGMFAFYYWLDSATFPRISVWGPLKRGITMMVYFLPVLVIIFAVMFGYNSLTMTFLPSSTLLNTIFLVVGNFIQFFTLLFGWSMTYVYYLQKR